MKFSITGFLRERNVDYRSSGENAMLSACPWCGREKKLSVNVNTGAFKCFSAHCGETGGAIKLVAKIAEIDWKSAKILVEGKKKPSRVGDDLQSLPDKSNEGPHAHKQQMSRNVQLPRTYEDLSEKHVDALLYLRKRGIEISDAKEMGIMACTVSKRIVFPVEFRDDLVGYVARDYTDLNDLKVLNAKNPFRDSTVYNFDRVRRKKTGRVIVCEGIVDAYKNGLDESVAILGAMMTTQQIQLIKELKPKEIYMALDPDLIDLNIKSAKEFLFLPDCKVFCVLPPVVYTKDGKVKDAGAQTREAQAEIIKNHSVPLESLLDSGGLKGDL